MLQSFLDKDLKTDYQTQIHLTNLGLIMIEISSEGRSIASFLAGFVVPLTTPYPQTAYAQTGGDAGWDLKWADGISEESSCVALAYLVF
ncbi:hypothetical protein QE152_g8865 [Popillia japonica]|uniref:Uncharacterized protein n=1 Tax=Popillia japonica TaxID=7064 RepID=A0AAW1M064_POPJA